MRIRVHRIERDYLVHRKTDNRNIELERGKVELGQRARVYAITLRFMV